ncbi:hypothetical protein PVAP13_5KG696100 [Panicum virgatum]|uniref:Uncharacterized protein n=1 Tax=Panicum virgatum TaxID=38727 RepID=A0A8T0SZU6_PANVG|nr:hypothetical protein PVAP13_5KG696100 [Panicum virgatum]
MVERVTQKNNTERGVRDAGSTAKELMKEAEKNGQNVSRLDDASVSELQNGNLPANEKEIQKVQKQVEKEIKRQEKEEAQMRKLQKKQQEEALREQKRREKEEAEAKKQQKKQEEEALKEQKRREKEEAEMKKQQKKQQEEAEKEQKRREKEAAQLKKQLAIQKQASMMERFFKSKKDSGKLQKSGDNDSAGPINKKEVPATTSKIDSSLSQQENWVLEDLRRLQVTGWQKLSSYNRSSRWSIRRKPKVEAFKELKLQKSSDDMVDEILSTQNEDSCHNSSQENEHDKLESDIDMLPTSEAQCHGTSNAKPLQTRLIRRKLLQFDKSNRPAYYGTWRKKSAVVGPRCPLKMDPDLDYEVDSDDEWEEEDPGESLSDCEKDGDEVMEEDSKITDEDEDSFVVPDGYLSDNEGIQIESLLDDKDAEACSSPTGQCTEVEEFRSLLRQQKVLNTLTEQALRKSQPLVISNLYHEKAELLTAEDLKGTAKVEQLCLQVLSMRICLGGAVVDVPSIDNSSASAEEINQSNVKNGSPASASAIPETDLPEIVQVIRSCRDGINKVVELLHQKFPNVSKYQLNRRVREISDFVDNHWKVRKLLHSKP